MTKKRETGIELLKIIAIFLIIISHVNQSLYTSYDWFDNNYIINLNHVTNSLKYFLLSWVSCLGVQGNIIMIVCSSWFLLESQKVNEKKIVSLMSISYFFSILFLMIFLFIDKFDIGAKYIIQCLFPITFELNWFVTFYLIFYIIHPILNHIINLLSKKQLLITNFIMFVIYYGLDFIQGEHFAFNKLMLFISIYFFVAYIKKYMKKFVDNWKINLMLFIAGIIGMLFLMYVTNILGTNIPFLSDKLLHWKKNNNPFFLLTAITMFNLFKKINRNSGIINYISSLSLLVYVIHENLLVRMYLRPIIWQYIYENIGYEFIEIIIVLYALCIFFVSIIIAIIYKEILEKKVTNIFFKVYIIIKRIMNVMVEKIIKIE